MKHLSYLIVCVLVALTALTACIDDSYTTSASDVLTFSTDTVTFDTVVTQQGTVTKQFIVYNRAKKQVNISSIKVAGNPNGRFYINVDGVKGEEFHDVDIRGGDSIFVFVECKVNESNAEEPLAVKDSIIFPNAVVGKNGPGKQSEGDTKTPLGTWEIGEAYGINDDPGSLLPYTKVTDDMYWCATGSNGKKYNTLIYRSDDPDADYSEDEHLIDYPVVYNYLLDLGYNRAGAPYAGNAIFLHCWRGPDSPTGGCVGVSEESMIKILQTVTPGTSVTIY